MGAIDPGESGSINNAPTIGQPQRASFLTPNKMKIKMWKVRGAAHPDTHTQMHLRQLLRQHKPDILFLTETGLGGVRAEELFREIPYSGLERVDPVGFSGGIWLFWNKGETTIDLIAKTD